MFRRFLAHISPEELLLIPVVILVIAAVIAQPTAITRLFEGPYATPIPGDSPADEVLDGRTPTPDRSPASVDRTVTPRVVETGAPRVLLLAPPPLRGR